MENKKKSLALTAALIFALTALALSALSLSTAPEDQSHRINDLYAKNASLQAQLDTVEEKLDQLIAATTLSSWDLDVAPWEDSTGADVTLTAIPSVYQSDYRASLIIKLDGREVHNLPCQWDGNAFTATAPVDAADGYSYFCEVTTAVGTQTLPLTGPQSSAPADCVYLASCLSTYCNLMVNGWAENAGESLILTDAYAQAQLPRLSTVGKVEILTAELTLRLNGETSVRIPVALAPSEVEGSLELMILDLEIPMPELADGDALELYLEVQLSDGRILEALGITWYMEQGNLSSAVG